MTWPFTTNHIPPFMGDDAVDPENRSPYPVTPDGLVKTFGYTKERRNILEGFFNTRSMLRAYGVSVALQWLDGSFVENKEILLKCPPNDIDVVTWLLECDENNENLKNINNEEEHKRIKKYHKTDLYVMEPRIELLTYWFGLFSHDRNSTWRGILSIELSSDTQEDDNAIAWLKAHL